MPTESNTRKASGISQQKMHNLPSRYYKTMCLMARQKLLQLGWEVLIHLPYSLDVVPSEFHLFWPLQNSHNGKKFSSLEYCKRHLEQFFAQKGKFWEDKIMKLPKRSQKTVEQNGEYIVQYSSW